MDATILATFNAKEPAERLKQILGDAAIKADVYDERKLQRYWFLSEPLAGIRVSVDKLDFPKAEELIRTSPPAVEVLRSAVHCPECRSPRIEYPQLTRKFLTPELASIFFALHLFDRSFYCTDCQFTWPSHPKPHVDRDVLGWPKSSKLFGTKPEPPGKEPVA